MSTPNPRPFYKRHWLLVGLFCFFIVAWCLHLTEASVDLLTGKTRVRQLLLGVCLIEQVRDSPFSEILRAENNGHPDWRVYSEVGPLQSISPFFNHGPTPSLLYETVLIGDELSASPETRRAIYAQVLERVRNSDQKGARELIENWRQSQK